ncbi:MAG: hypothetical protein JGK17_32455 [Microcoleus sp. PH2017_10_PVI_O_A]|uniref:hypothetical protein n=1 Tax=unclassified Microcoleus TaxID=2642155 RepID=UPI001D5EFA8D|nr:MULTISPECIES: hypothetical protein [unclassified Microcoleus]MCC3410161.1 hypothetical protein [Microcoleus sp. PH2017_10_PVI_O_A]MCC3476500.1 hypothetical protein [Microcoleus sp. PH2017_12_PCY_D_A]MCC3563733.1 hypothetical protein [Microcoleus sp. PH2017_27_LUM_O_A]
MNSKYQTYPPGVQKQIGLFLQHEDGKGMVERYLAIIDSADYLERSPTYDSRRGMKKNDQRPITNN